MSPQGKHSCTNKAHTNVPTRQIHNVTTRHTHMSPQGKHTHITRHTHTCPHSVNTHVPARYTRISPQGKHSCTKTHTSLPMKAQGLLKLFDIQCRTRTHEHYNHDKHFLRNNVTALTHNSHTQNNSSVGKPNCQRHVSTVLIHAYIYKQMPKRICAHKANIHMCPQCRHSCAHKAMCKHMLPLQLIDRRATLSLGKCIGRITDIIRDEPQRQARRPRDDQRRARDDQRGARDDQRQARDATQT